MNTLQFEYGKKQIVYILQRSERRKTISIQVSATGIKVNAPKNLSLEVIGRQVQQKATWIVQRATRFEELHGLTPASREFVSGESLRYLGRQYRLKRLPSTESKPMARLWGRFIEVTANTPDEVKTALENWYKKQAKQYLLTRVAFMSSRMGLSTPPPVLIRSPQLRWGSCNKAGEIRLNWRIVMASQSLIDYVIAHELCHLEQPSHSQAFWKAMYRVMPDYAERRERLAVMGVQFTL
jgi:predicted metal-dependent hydrolase